MSKLLSKTSILDKETLETLLKFGVTHGASDIHFEVGAPPCYRVKGDLLRARAEALTPEQTRAAATLLLGRQEVDLSQPFSELDTSYSIAGLSRFRVSIFRQRGSVGCILRTVPYQIRSLEELRLPTVLAEIVKERRGLLLVTGVTGSGKSTTIASLLEVINETRNCHIITVEDPIEFLFSNKNSLIIQREVGTDTRSYEEALVAALRQDPDVIMLGEIRERTTASICIKAAETGHMVISTLHTPDVVSTLKRLTGLFSGSDVNSELARLADCIKAIVSLRLVPRADGKGLVPAVEVLRATPTIQSCIRDPNQHGDILQHIISGRDMYGMQTFDAHLMELVRAGTIKLSVAKLAASRPAELERALLLDS